MADKKDELEKTVERLNKEFGKGSVMNLKDDTVEGVEAIPTGSLKLDVALGVGGVPKGRIIEIFGAESAGKTTLATHMVAESQKQGGTAAYLDVEHSFDPEYAQNLGVNLDDFYISQPDTGEQALNIVDRMVGSGMFDVIVIDSVSALVPQAELEGDMGDSHIGLQARLMSQALRKLTGKTEQTNTTIVFINQIRMRVGVRFGNPETTSGGRALRFYSSVRMKINRVGKVEDGGEEIGNRTRVWVKKNKVAAPKKKVRFDLIFGEGISRLGEIVELGIDFGIIDKAGAWYSMGDETLAQGKENLKEWLREHPDVKDDIESQIMDQIQNG